MPKPRFREERGTGAIRETTVEPASDELSDDDLERVSGGISLITPAVQSARLAARRTE